MKKRNHGRKKLQPFKDLWINPRSNIRGPEGNRAGDNAGNISPSSGARFLELADVALGLKKPASSKKRAAAAGHHTTQTTHKAETHIQRIGRLIVTDTRTAI